MLRRECLANCADVERRFSADYRWLGLRRHSRKFIISFSLFFVLFVLWRDGLSAVSNHAKCILISQVAANSVETERSKYSTVSENIVAPPSSRSISKYRKWFCVYEVRMFAAKRECIIIILLSFETILRLAFAAEREHKHLIRALGRGTLAHTNRVDAEAYVMWLAGCG